jgi:hypothetical protein
MQHHHIPMATIVGGHQILGSHHFQPQQAQVAMVSPLASIAPIHRQAAAAPVIDRYVVLCYAISCYLMLSLYLNPITLVWLIPSIAYNDHLL